MDAVVLGAGSWGTALALLLARAGGRARLLGRDVAALAADRENRRYLPGFPLPDAVTVGPLAPAPADLAVLAVPGDAVAEVAPLARGSRTVVVAGKGFEPGTNRLLADVVAELCPGSAVAVLSGPNLAGEIARGFPTVAVAASADPAAAEATRAAFHGPTFRVSLSDDVDGTEVAGALKNVLALGAGMSDGLGFGDNAKGALLSRGLMEMARVGIAMGGRMETFLGPAGVGDLFATAASRLSRNHRVGELLGAGVRLDDALARVGQVAEGVPSSASAVALARAHGVDAPVFGAVAAVVSGRLAPTEAVARLMDRRVRMDDFEG